MFRDCQFKQKDLIPIPWMVAMALQQDGWYLRSSIIWHKPNCMPESVTDRPTTDFEHVFLLAKRARYYYDAEAIAERAAESSDGWQSRARRGESTLGADSLRNNDRNDGGECVGSGRAQPTRNRRAVWTIPTQPYSGAHFATFPPALVSPCILAGTSARGACSKCGAPFERVVEKTERPRQPLSGVRETPQGTHKAIGQQYNEWLKAHPDVTLGWRPTCDCDENEPVPCVCLDPFGGSGTVAKVAHALGRDAVSIDLNPEYTEMSRRRIERVEAIEVPDDNGDEPQTMEQGLLMPIVEELDRLLEEV